MSKLIFSLCFGLVVAANNLSAQPAVDVTRDFQISSPTQKITGSLYSSIDLIDSRVDKTNIGIVQVGGLNRKAKVVFDLPLATQLQALVGSLTDSSAANGELLFHLRQLTFAEITGAMNEKGYCYLRAALYARTDEGFKRLLAIDTVVLVKSLDVTKALFRKGSQVITELIAKCLHQKSTDTVTYRYKDVVKMDSLEKRKFAVYNVEKYAEGFYFNYQAFRDQIPDKQITVRKKKDGSISTVSILEENGEWLKIKPKDAYAFVHEGSPYMATDYGFYPLNKSNDDFYFIGKTKASANTIDVVGATLLFGIVGGLLASETNATFVMKVDHINGGFIHLREIKETSQ